MKGIRFILGFMLAIGLLLLAGRPPVSILAQEPSAPSHEFKYDAAKQVVVEGFVEEVKEYRCPVSGTVGAHITVKQSFGSIEIHLAPVTFMKKYEIAINKGDRVAIQGSKILFEGKPALIAKTVADDSTTYAFRDSDGRPLW
jgi:DNA/RNA endonuclease YhcR with UshA esterase domain